MSYGFSGKNIVQSNYIESFRPQFPVYVTTSLVFPHRSYIHHMIPTVYNIDLLVFINQAFFSVRWELDFEDNEDKLRVLRKWQIFYLLSAVFVPGI